MGKTECKWTKRPIGIDLLRALAKAKLAADEIGDKRILFGLCSHRGFTPQMQQEAARRSNLLLFDLPSIAA